ncbi:MAG: response regulator [Bacteroidetes bacterium]|nr:response regulator [Bacteroidota bacterium]MBK8413443.1 response regulator [Bacteroidota bacterium]MBK8876751.1 response regulator [Bacteroidota bacterium]MBK9046353.1 response regulator [Bacteroidota bacterium]MBK9424943.1 response regulator [Bacteroidota bacterium]
MSKIKILVVEDESIVAKDIQNTLIRLGYDVPATASNAASAFQKLDDIMPDLVFLDIKLKGDIDGIEIAEKIKNSYEIPVIFLTSFVDKTTLDRAKVTEPYGYIVKPFNESDLQTTVEMALYKFEKDKETKYNKERYENALVNLDEAIVILDINYGVTFLNPKAENLAGYGNETAAGKDLFSILKIENELHESLTKEQISEKIKTDKICELKGASVTFIRDQSVHKSDLTISPVRDEKDTLIGYALVIRKQGAAAGAGSTPGSSEQMESLVIQNSFFVKKGSMLVKVFLENINWIQAMDNYVIIATNTDQFVVHSTMKDIEMKLPGEKFLRVHRSYIIPIEKINVLDENTVLIGDKTIPVGKSYKDTFMNRLNFL